MLHQCGKSPLIRGRAAVSGSAGFPNSKTKLRAQFQKTKLRAQGMGLLYMVSGCSYFAMLRRPCCCTSLFWHSSII